MRHPEYNPWFTDVDIRQAEENCRRRNAPHVQVQRAKLVLYLHEHPGVFSSIAADALGMHEQTVRKWRKLPQVSCSWPSAFWNISEHIGTIPCDGCLKTPLIKTNQFRWKGKRRSRKHGVS